MPRMLARHGEMRARPAIRSLTRSGRILLAEHSNFVLLLCDTADCSNRALQWLFRWLA